MIKSRMIGFDLISGRDRMVAFTETLIQNVAKKMNENWTETGVQRCRFNGREEKESEEDGRGGGKKEEGKLG